VQVERNITERKKQRMCGMEREESIVSAELPNTQIYARTNKKHRIKQCRSPWPCKKAHNTSCGIPASVIM